MAMDFPASPTVGAIYSPVGGPTYRWDGSLWVPQSGAAGYLEKANNLSDVQNVVTARDNLGLTWRTLARFYPTVDIAQLTFGIPSDVKLVRGTFGVTSTGPATNLGIRWSRDNGATVEAGATDYWNTYFWVNNATTPGIAYSSGLSYHIISPVPQTGVRAVGTFEMDPGQDGVSLASINSVTNQTDAAGSVSIFSCGSRAASAASLAGGRRNWASLFPLAGQMKAFAYLIVEGAS